MRQIPRSLVLKVAVLPLVAFLAGCYPPAPVEPPSPRPTPKAPEQAINIEKLMPPKANIVEEFRRAQEKHGQPRFVIMINRPLDMQTVLQPLTRTLRKIQVGGRIVPTITADDLGTNIRLQPPPEPSTTSVTDDMRTYERPAQPSLPPGSSHSIPYRQLEDCFAAPFLDAGCFLLDSTWVWVKARGSRPAPTIAELNNYADILITLDVESQHAQVGHEAVPILNIAASAIDLPSGRLLARAFAYVRPASPSRAAPPATSAVASALAFELRRLQDCGLRIAGSLMRQIKDAWQRGSMYTITLRALTSETQLGHVCEYLTTLQGVRQPLVRSSSFEAGKGGTAIVQLDFTGPPDELVKKLRRADAFSGFRLEIVDRRYTKFTMAVVDR